MNPPELPDSVYRGTRLACPSQQTNSRVIADGRADFMLTAPDESKQQKIPLYSSKYFQACTIGGILACGENPRLFSLAR